MVLVIQNDSEVPPGLLGEILENGAVDYRVVEAAGEESLPDPEGYRAVVVLGGAQGVADLDRLPGLRAVEALCRDAVTADVPLLGICLGAQLLAHALGGTVNPNRDGEKGLKRVQLTLAGGRDPLFWDIPYGFDAYQWHDDSLSPPLGAVVLATGEPCRYQAFRVGRRAYGVQFHPEATGEIARSWASRAGRSLEAEAIPLPHAGSRASAAVLLTNFLRLSGLARRPAREAAHLPLRMGSPS